MKLRRHRKNREGVQDQLRTLIRRVHELVAGLDRSTFNRRPGEGEWSVAECLDHLNATARLYLPELTEAIESARREGLTGSRRDGRTLVGRLIAWSMEPPARFRMTTFAETEPDRDLEPEEVVDAFESLHEELIVRINESADLDRKRVKLRSVLDRRLKLSLDDWYAFLAAHARRHVWQAAKALERLEGQ
ncbi:MAG: hypothetical protein GWN02_24870 [Gemmatimonadetes bacterium]|nr:hypothetical protein [Gemmatimonadota bacterium]